MKIAEKLQYICGCKIFAMKEYPILMADIIKSRLHDGKEIMEQFRKIVYRLNQNRKADLLSPLTITLGDEFQGVVNTIENGIHIILEMEELILEMNLEIKLRYVLVFGEIETKINPKIAFEMLGKGLTSAREKLNGLKTDHNRFFVSLGSENELKEVYINKLFLIYQNFVDSWKTKDRKMVSYFLQLNDYKTVAKKMKVDKSSAWRRKKSLHIEEYLNTKEIIIFVLKS